MKRKISLDLIMARLDEEGKAELKKAIKKQQQIKAATIRRSSDYPKLFNLISKMAVDEMLKDVFIYLFQVVKMQETENALEKQFMLLFKKLVISKLQK